MEVEKNKILKFSHVTYNGYLLFPFSFSITYNYKNAQRTPLSATQLQVSLRTYG